MFQPLAFSSLLHTAVRNACKLLFGEGSIPQCDVIFGLKCLANVHYQARYAFCYIYLLWRVSLCIVAKTLIQQRVEFALFNHPTPQHPGLNK